MQITIKYFGLLTEITNCEEETINFNGSVIAELLDQLFIKYTGLKMKDFQVAQNTELVGIDAKVTGDDIVLLPPFSGG
jgi:molybdopterin synthase sulfur carrier subunit